jgi:hypothetical protein
MRPAGLCLWAGGFRAGRWLKEYASRQSFSLIYTIWTPEAASRALPLKNEIAGHGTMRKRRRMPVTLGHFRQFF